MRVQRRMRRKRCFALLVGNLCIPPGVDKYILSCSTLLPVINNIVIFILRLYMFVLKWTYLVCTVYFFSVKELTTFLCISWDFKQLTEVCPCQHFNLRVTTQGFVDIRELTILSLYLPGYFLYSSDLVEHCVWWLDPNVSLQVSSLVIVGCLVAVLFITGHCWGLAYIMHHLFPRLLSAGG